ncbi:thioredoxin domain-containing protein [Nocardioides zeae]|uniref:Thioredoxin domain-containing protein n=1 Tax=Nocardioides imazamoxiresistens TaxID=3231893 RepID=A0ABU3PYH1_9ACTN|nr:thioredoxin domain-containing protein [Nocardioides zeae]MDT9594278.1 thioredoxin domain-containing protein [Nocardioides zeae]
MASEPKKKVPTKKTGPTPSRVERAAAARRQAEKGAWIREWAIVIGVVAVVAVLIGGAFLVSGGDSPLGGDDDELATSGPTPAVATAEAGEGSADGAEAGLVGEVTADGGLAFGDPAAPHRVVIYEDFLCPFCGQLEAAVGDDLAELVASGDTVVEYRALNFLSRIGDYSLRAANAFAVVMDASGPQVARDFHDLVFANQPAESGEMPDDDWLVERAVEAGADEDAVRTGIVDQEFAGWVNRGTLAASDAGVASTPTVLVDGEELTGYETLDELAALIVERASA